MKTLLLVALSYCFTLSLHGQQYGNVDTTSIQGGFSPDFITTWATTTGANDSGNFTHVGYHAKNGATNVRMGIYSDVNGDPSVLLGETGQVSPQLNTFNLFPLQTPISLSPGTVYHIAIHTNVQSGTSAPNNISTKPYHYKFRLFGQGLIPTLTSLSAATGRNVAIYAVANNVGLPVELESFSVTKQEEISAIKLEWKTASESQNHGWSVDRSHNGTTWKTIAWIEGNGDTDTEEKYDYLDRAPVEGLSYYRITQEDFDGTKSSSEIRMIMWNNIQWKIFPNPAQEELHIRGVESAEINIYDSQGKCVQSGNLDNDYTISLKDILRGQYNIQIIHEQGVKNFNFTKI